MSQKPIREVQAKKLFQEHWPLDYARGDTERPVIDFVAVGPKTNLAMIAPPPSSPPSRGGYPRRERVCVAKVDELFGKRGKLGYVKVAKDFQDAKKWIKGLRGKEVQIGERRGILNNFLIEPFIPHKKEYYVSFIGERECDVFLYSEYGGMDIEEQNKKNITRVEIPLTGDFIIAAAVPKKLHPTIYGLFTLFRRLDLGYLEINPLVYENERAYLLDTKVRVDTAAAFRQQHTWGKWEIPDGFGRAPTKEELAIRDLDAKTGSSLKFVLLNPNGRIWTMVAGGGASIIYADAITNQVDASELANYGEWSGNPSTDEMEEYTKNILELMTKKVCHGERSRTTTHKTSFDYAQDDTKKALIIGGGIANFTDIAKTFMGVIKALRAYQKKLKHVSIFVRRAGPNDKKGLAMLQHACDEMKIPCVTYGAELPMTKIVNMAIEKLRIPKKRTTYPVHTEARSTKHEARSKFKYSKYKYTKQSKNIFFMFLSFMLVSYFGFRISDFLFS